MGIMVYGLWTPMLGEWDGRRPAEKLLRWPDSPTTPSLAFGKVQSEKRTGHLRKKDMTANIPQCRQF